MAESATKEYRLFPVKNRLHKQLLRLAFAKAATVNGLIYYGFSPGHFLGPWSPYPWHATVFKLGTVLASHGHYISFASTALAFAGAELVTDIRKVLRKKEYGSGRLAVEVINTACNIVAGGTGTIIGAVWGAAQASKMTSTANSIFEPNLLRKITNIQWTPGKSADLSNVGFWDAIDGARAATDQGWGIVWSGFSTAWANANYGAQHVNWNAFLSSPDTEASLAVIGSAVAGAVIGWKLMRPASRAPIRLYNWGQGHGYVDHVDGPLLHRF